METSFLKWSNYKRRKDMAKGLIYNTKLIGFQDNYSYNCLELFFDQDEIAMILY